MLYIFHILWFIESGLLVFFNFPNLLFFSMLLRLGKVGASRSQSQMSSMLHWDWATSWGPNLVHARSPLLLQQEKNLVRTSYKGLGPREASLSSSWYLPHLATWKYPEAQIQIRRNQAFSSCPSTRRPEQPTSSFSSGRDGPSHTILPPGHLVHPWDLRGHDVITEELPCAKPSNKSFPGITLYHFLNEPER